MKMPPISKKLLYLAGAGAIIGLIVLVSVGRQALVVFDDAYRSPVESDLAESTPAMLGAADVQAAIDEKLRTKPLEEAGVPL